MRKLLLLSFLSLCFVTAKAQVENTVVNWRDVQVYEFTKRYAHEDSTETVVGEWFVKGEASSLSDLSSKELTAIKKTVAKKGCNIAYVDVRKVYTPRKGQLYVLCIRSKK